MNSTFYVNTIYVAFQGEANIAGIGAPVIFVRLQGCHLRCYKATMGTLCDTPEALEGKTGGTVMTTVQILTKVIQLSKEAGGIKLICLTGGDPLWRKSGDLKELLLSFARHDFHTSIETSGTLPIRPYKDIPNLSWVLDFKLKSAGVKQSFIFQDLICLSKKDFIKFVVYDSEDYTEFLAVLPEIQAKTKATITIGTYWGGKIRTMELFDMLRKSKLLGKVTLNVQLHKLAFFYDANMDDVDQTVIPMEI